MPNPYVAAPATHTSFRAVIACNFRGRGGLGLYARRLCAALETSDWSVERAQEPCDTPQPIADSPSTVWVRHGWAHDGVNSFARANFLRHIGDDPARNVLAFGFDPSFLASARIADINARFAAVLTDSKWTAARARAAGIMLPAIPLPPPAAEPQPEARRRVRGQRQGPFVFLHVANGNPYIKGTDRVIAAFQASGLRRDEARLVLKVSGTGKDHVAALAATLGGFDLASSPHIRIDDRRLSNAGMSSVYAVADCYVHVSRSESLGLPPLEAALHDIPVIMHRGGAADEVAALVTHYEVPYETGIIPTGRYRENAVSQCFEVPVSALASMMRSVARRSQEPTATASGHELARACGEFTPAVRHALRNVLQHQVGGQSA